MTNVIPVSVAENSTSSSYADYCNTAFFHYNPSASIEDNGDNSPVAMTTMVMNVIPVTVAGNAASSSNTDDRNTKFYNDEIIGHLLTNLKKSRSVRKQLRILMKYDVGMFKEPSPVATAILTAILRQFHCEMCSQIRKIRRVSRSVASRSINDVVFQLIRSTIVELLWKQITAHDFWQFIFPRLCDIAFFVKIPSNAEANESFQDLFSDIRICNYAHTTVRKPMDWMSEQIKNDISTGEKSYAEINDLIYRQLWKPFNAILGYSNRLVWNFLTTTPIDDRTVLLICQAFEEAMMLGHAILAAPLSVHVPLITLNALVVIQSERLSSLLNRAKLGVIFNNNIAYSILASLQFTLITRGIRPITLWLPRQECPWFIIRHTALGLYHFQQGLMNGGLLIQRARSVDATSTSSRYNSDALLRKIRVFCYNSNVTVLEDYEVYDCIRDRTILSELANFFELRLYRVYVETIGRFYETNDHLLAVEMTQENYHVDRRQRRVMYTLDFSDDNSNDNNNNAQNIYYDETHRDRPTIAPATSSNNRANDQYSNLADGVADIMRHRALTIQDKCNLLHMESVNTLAIMPMSPYYNELIPFQLNGLREFPKRTLSLKQHLASLHLLYSLYTLRLLSVD